jgi:tRNA uridine 5-carbamoylmethylation protein Kti12
MSKLKVVNLFGGPGCGKSTTRAELFALFKKSGHNVEEVTEFAKDLTWEKNQTAFADQLFLLANQNRRQFRLQNQVEWCVTDSPILLGVNYVTPEYLPHTFRSISLELWDTYENHNFFIERTRPYQSIGRNQSESEAKQIDANIKRMLHEFNIPFKTVRGEGDTAKQIFDIIDSYTRIEDQPLSRAEEILKKIKEQTRAQRTPEEQAAAEIEAAVEKVFSTIKDTTEEFKKIFGEFKGRIK